MKKFYKTVSVASHGVPEPHYAVLLDDRPVRTPARNPVRLPGAALAEAIAAEWEAQDDEISVARMPLMQIAATALDRVAPDADSYVGRIAAYGETDLLCYRSPNPQALTARQWATWQPLVDWASEALLAPLTVTSGVAPVAQPSDTLAALRRAIAAHDVFELAALSVATTASGSLVIALALSHGRLDARDAFEAAFLDENWQIEQWGADEEAERRQRNARADIEAAARFFELHRDG